MTKQKDCLHCKIIDTIKKYGKQNGGVYDGEIVEALARVLADVMNLHDQAAQTNMREFVDWCLADQLSLPHDITQWRN